MATVDKLAGEALSLSEKDRLKLVAKILQSCPPVSDAEFLEIETEWDEEIQRRAEEMRSGKDKGTLAQDVFSEIRASKGWPEK